MKLLVGSKSGSSALKRQALIDIRGLAVHADIRNEWKVVGVAGQIKILATGRNKLKTSATTAKNEDYEEKSLDKRITFGEKRGRRKLAAEKSSAVALKKEKGYNVVSACKSINCSLELKAGTIEISDKTMKSVLGLPMGSESIEQGDNEERLSLWGKQFEGCLGCKVSPLMLSNRIQGNCEKNAEFKLNFLVLLYNFFIKGHQNMFINHDVLRYSLDIYHYGKYNWCRLLIERLKVSHDYWTTVKSRYFTGSLPFPIYLYVSTLRVKGTIHIPPMYPAFRGWSDSSTEIGIQVKDSEIASAEDRQGTIAAENKNLDAMDESGSKGNRDGDNISDEALVVEDSLTLHDECLNDGWEEWVNPTQEHNLNDADFAQPGQPTVCNATKKDGTDKTADEDKGERSNVAREECKNLGETTELLTMTQYMGAVTLHFKIN
ncbi:hypothetical protein DCAR_0101597 [Daucus carota subsp. sativus]|uniref:Uncharacterized protein n=1 Tax=Daucus carota subsp. sativus TaxID=79200 RepID=A0A166GFJ4_DAUCS|nr:hypothetical protein DCAR_0101597 [Daucus carota subsp. sativus]